MKKILEKIFVLFKPESRQTKFIHKSRGQSLVEFAIAFPVVIMLFSGVVEFGFILNYYLSLLDATREAARFYSIQDPWGPGSSTDWFYTQAAQEVKYQLEPSSVNDTSRKIVLDPTKDDVIVTVYSMCGSTIYSFPTAGGYHLYGNGTSVFTNTSMANSRLGGAPDAGLILVEVNYNYRQVLALPWLTVFLSNPLPLRAYTIMPLRAAEPGGSAPTPGCPT